MSAWARNHLEDARLLLLYSRHDFVQGKWPEALRRGVMDQSDRLQVGLLAFARQAFGRATPAEVRCATFVLVEAPGAAVKEHIRRREPPPALVDELITKTYCAIVPK